MKSLHDQLKEIGVAIDDKELAMTLLASLPEEFKPLISALDAVGDEKLSYLTILNVVLMQKLKTMHMLPGDGIRKKNPIM